MDYAMNVLLRDIDLAKRYFMYDFIVDCFVIVDSYQITSIVKKLSLPSLRKIESSDTEQDAWKPISVMKTG